FFLDRSPTFSHLARDTSGALVGCIVAKIDDGKTQPAQGIRKGYIGMVVVCPSQRRKGIAKELVLRSIKAMMADGVTEVFLEAESPNEGAIAFYERLGFFKQRLLPRYYMSGQAAFRMKLYLDGVEKREGETPSALSVGLEEMDDKA
ncbi:hypothetical protein KIPB_012612, partial [Kipferlia bialata]